MIKIRRGVFETNSSSMHSIVVTKGEKSVMDEHLFDHIYVSKDGVLTLWGGELEFGRQFQLLTNWKERMCYAIASSSPETVNDILEIVKERTKKIKEFDFPTDYDDEVYHGYIDHQSIGLFDSFISKYNVSIEDFIFNDKYIVFVDGDEYDVTSKVMNLIDSSKIETVFDTWEV